MEVDSMALNEIIQSAEIIEAEKSKAMDPDHKKIWAALYNELTIEEANGFYFALKKIRVLPEKTIIQQGRLNNRLFFIEQGAVRVVYFKEGRELFLKHLFQGEISGSHTFFSISVATASTLSMEPCRLRYLEREDYDKLVMKFAGFDRKLAQFCKEKVKLKIEEILKNKGFERRNNYRHNAAGKVALYTLDANKTPSKIPIYGVLEDISEGGASFCIKSSSTATARQYLGKQVLMKVVSGTTGASLTQKGIVLSVYNQLFQQYLLGLRFAAPISSLKIKEFISMV